MDERKHSVIFSPLNKQEGYKGFEMNWNVLFIGRVSPRKLTTTEEDKEMLQD